MHIISFFTRVLKNFVSSQGILLQSSGIEFHFLILFNTKDFSKHLLRALGITRLMRLLDLSEGHLLLSNLKFSILYLCAIVQWFRDLLSDRSCRLAFVCISVMLRSLLLQKTHLNAEFCKVCNLLSMSFLQLS